MDSSVQTLVGYFSFESSDNLDDYLKGVGVGLVLRKVHSVAKPNFQISQSAETNQWTIKSETVFRVKEYTFKPLEKFQCETFDSRNCQTTVEVLENDCVMKLHQICDEGPPVESIMTATKTGLVLEMVSGEFRCVLRFQRGRFPPEPREAAVNTRRVNHEVHHPMEDVEDW